MAKVTKKTVKKGKAPASKAAKSRPRAAAVRSASKKSASGTGIKYAQAGAPWWKQYLPK